MSTRASPADLKEMDLQLKNEGDETVKYGQWNRKIALHNLAKRSYQSDRPEEDGEWWMLSGTQARIPGTPTCTLPVVILRLMAYIPIGGRKKNCKKYPFTIVDEEGFLAKKQLAVWIKEWMMLANAEADGFTHLVVAASKEEYKIPDYENYIPTQVKENCGQLIEEFIRNHKERHPTLSKEMISTFFSSFICGLDLFNPEQIDHHFKEIHGLEQGIMSLGHSRTPTEDTIQPLFICPSLLGIEDRKETDQVMITEILFHRCKASGMLFDTGLTPNVKPLRAQELVSGIQTASDSFYFKRFTMLLGQALRNQDQDVFKDFTCGWETIQSALIGAIGDDRTINKMLLVNSLGHKDFSGQPLALLFYEIDKKVDEYMGTQETVVYDVEMRPQCLNTYTLYLKYNLIIDVAVNLNENFDATRVSILREVSQLYFNASKLMSLSQFTKDLINVLEKKNISSEFRKKIILPRNTTKKGLMDHDGVSVFKKRYEAKRSSGTEDKKKQDELMNMARGLANSPFLDIDSNYVIDHPEIEKMIKKYGKQICGHCFSGNCRLKQTLSMKLGLSELQTNSGCEGSPKLTFADVRTEEKGAASTTPSAMTPPLESPQPPLLHSRDSAARSVADFLEEYDRTTKATANIRINTISLREIPEESEDLQTISEVQDTEEKNEEEDTAGVSEVHEPFNARNLEEEDPVLAALLKNLEKEDLESTPSVTRLAITTAEMRIRRPAITECTIPTKWDAEHGEPRACIICLKPNLAMGTLRTHVQFYHKVSIGDPVSKWKRAAEAWDEKQANLKPCCKAGASCGVEGGCGTTPNGPSVPAHQVKNSDSVNQGARKDPPKNKPIATHTSTLGKIEPNGDTLLEVEKRISSAQSQLETRCAAHESKIQAEYNANSSKISELLKQQTANTLSQSQFETRCAATQSKLLEDIDKITNAVKVIEDNKNQTELVNRLEAEMAKLSELVAECSSSKSTIQNMISVQNEVINSNTINYSNLVELKNSMQTISSRLDKLDSQVKTNLEQEGCTSQDTATNRKPTGDDKFVAKTPDKHTTIHPDQTRFYSPNSHTTLELASNSVKPNAETDIETSAKRADKPRLESQLQSRPPPDVQLSAGNNSNSVLKSEEKTRTQTREAQLNSQSYLPSTQSSSGITFIGHSVIMDRYPPPTRNKEQDGPQDWWYNNRFGVLSLDSDEYSSSDEEGSADPLPATAPPATPTPATSDPATAPPATPDPATTDPAPATPLPPCAAPATLRPGNPAANSPQRTIDEREREAAETLRREEEMLKALKKQAEEDLAKALRQREKDLKKIEEEISRSLKEQEELDKSIRRIREEAAGSHKKAEEERAKMSEFCQEFRDELNNAREEIKGEAEKHVREVKESSSKSLTEATMQKAHVSRELEKMVNETREEIREEADKTIKEVKEISIKSIAEARKSQTNDSGVTTHSREGDPSNHCPFCDESMETRTAVFQHIRDSHTLPTPQPSPPTHDDTDPSVAEEHICGVSGRVTYDCVPGCKPGNHYGNTMKLKDIKARNEAMKHKWQPHVYGSPTTITPPEPMEITIRVNLTAQDTPPKPTLTPIDTGKGAQTKKPTQQQTKEKPKENLINDVIGATRDLFTDVHPAKPILLVLLIIANCIKSGYGLIASPFISAATYPFSWIPSNITGADLAALTRNITRSMDRLDTDIPTTTPPGSDTNIPATTPPCINDQSGSAFPIRAVLLSGCLAMLIGGIAYGVIIRRRNRSKDQEEEGSHQDNNEEEEGILSRMLDRYTQLEHGILDKMVPASWTRKQELIQLE